MKNLILLSILAILIFVANSLFKNEHEKDYAPNAFAITNDFDAIELPNVKIVRNGEVAYLENGLYPVDQQLLKTIISYLQLLKKDTLVKENEITKEELENYFKNSFVVKYKEAGKTTLYKFGALNQYTGRILVEIVEDNVSQLYFVQDHNVAPRAYQDISQAATQKFDVLKKLIFIDKKQIFSKIIFSEELLNQVVRLKFLSENRPEYIVDLTLKTTIPAIPNGINYDQVKFETILDDFFNIMADDIFIDAKKANLGKEIASIILTRKDGKEQQVKLYNGLADTPGFYITSTFSTFIFKLKQLDKKYFYTTAKDFWDLKFRLPNFEKEILFKDGIKKINFKLSNSVESLWFKQLEQMGLPADDYILANDRLRSPKLVDKVFDLNIGQANYSFYYDRSNWFVFDPIVKVYYVFNPLKFPPNLNTKKFLNGL